MTKKKHQEGRYKLKLLVLTKIKKIISTIVCEINIKHNLYCLATAKQYKFFRL